MIPAALRANPSGWLVVAFCFAALMAAYAIRSSIGLMMPFWETEPGWTRDHASNAGALALLLMAVVSPFAGNLIDRFGPRAVCAGGLSCVAIGVMATAAATRDWHLPLFYGGLVGIGSGAIAMPMVSAAVAQYFSSGRGLASGVGFSGATGGQLVALPVLGLMVTALGWRGTYTALGVATLAIAAVAWLLLRRRPEAAAETDARALVPVGERLRYVLSSGTFWLLAIGFLICGFSTAGVIEVHLIPYAEFCGFAPIEGATAYGVHGAFNMVGVILAGFLADRLHRPRLLASIYFIRVVLFALLMQVAGSLSLLFVFAALYGFFNFAAMPVVAHIIASRMGVGVIGLAMGLIFGGHWLGAAAGAYLGGAFYSLWARYDELWIVSALAVALAGCLSLFVPEDRRREPALQPA